MLMGSPLYCQRFLEEIQLQEATEGLTSSGSSSSEATDAEADIWQAWRNFLVAFHQPNGQFFFGKKRRKKNK